MVQNTSPVHSEVSLVVNSSTFGSFRPVVGAYGENARTVASRKIYQRGSRTPMSNVDLLWRDYANFESVRRFSHTLAHTLTYTHTLSHAYTHTHRYIHWLTYTHTLTHTYTYTLVNTLTHTHTHSHTR